MADTLREFLIAIGFKVDDASYKKFSKAVDDVSKNVKKLDEKGIKGLSESAAAFGRLMGVVAGGVATAALAVTEATNRVSEDLNNLYIASQKTGATVSNIDALRTAAQRISVGADQAQAALTAFSLSMYTNPGNRSLLNMLGIHGKDDAELLDGFMHMIAKLPQAVQGLYASTYGPMLGIPVDVIKQWVLNIGLADKVQAEHNKLMKEAGVDEDDLAKKHGELTQNWQRMHEEVRALSLSLDSKLVPSMIDATGWVNRQIESLIVWSANQETLSSRFDRLGDAITGTLGPMDEWKKRLDDASKSYFSDSGVTAGIERFGESLRSALNPLHDADAGFAAFQARVLDLNWIKALATAAKALLDFKGIIHNLSRADFATAREDFQRLLQDIPQVGLDLNSGTPVSPYSSGSHASGSHAARAGGTQGSGGAVGSVHDRLAQGMAFFQAQGVPRYAAAGIMAQFLNENSTLDPDIVNDTGHRGIAQWNAGPKGRQAGFEAWAGHSMEGSTYDEQLQYAWHEMLTTHQTALAKILLAGQQGGASAAGFAGTDFEVPVLPSHTQDYFAQQQKRAATADQLYYDRTIGSSDKNVTVTQDIDINVHGGSDSAEQIGRGVHRELQRNNADTARNFNTQTR